jgi:hypothetical protein
VSCLGHVIPLDQYDASAITGVDERATGQLGSPPSRARTAARARPTPGAMRDIGVVKDDEGWPFTDPPETADRTWF